MTKDELDEMIKSENGNQEMKEEILNPKAILAHDALEDINNAIKALMKLEDGDFKSFMPFVDLEVVDLISNVDYSEMARRLKRVRDLVFGSVINWEYVCEAVKNE